MREIADADTPVHIDDCKLTELLRLSRHTPGFADVCRIVARSPRTPVKRVAMNVLILELKKPSADYRACGLLAKAAGPAAWPVLDRLARRDGNPRRRGFVLPLDEEDDGAIRGPCI
jgi:hypothetical protein